MPEQPRPAGAVFISYCSPDAPAARRIAEALRSAGIEVWLDQNELRAGDAWEAQITKQIHDCALFVPVISAHTDARAEGYFRGEWRLATRRLQNMADDAPFLVPVVIDNTREAEARVPAEFLHVQWSWLPGGEAPPAFAQRVRQLLSGSYATQVEQLASIGGESDSSMRRGDSGRSPARRYRLALVALPVLLAGASFWYLQARNDPAPAVAPASSVPAAVTESSSIAVLPFADMSAEKDQEYMSDGIAEEVLNLLAQVRELKVIARTSSFSFKGQNLDIAAIAKRLNVAHVLEGSVRKSGDNLRITAQLIRAADSTHVWSNTYDRKLNDIFAVQTEIANAIVQALQIKLMGGTLSRSEGGTENVEAYQLYLRAGKAMNELNEVSLEAAEQHLRRALELDPDFGRAWSRLADVVSFKLSGGYIASKDGYDRMEEYAKRALQVSPNIAEAHAHLQGVYAVRDFDWVAAEREGQLALAIDPNDPVTLGVAAGAAAIFGKYDEAERYARLAVARAPDDLALLAGLASVYYQIGHYQESERIERSIIEQQPDRGWVRAGLSYTLLAQGKVEEARAMLAQEPEEGARLGILPVVLHAAGRQSEADEALKKQIAFWASEWATCIARTYAYRGDNDRALEWLERAYQQRDSAIYTIIDDPLTGTLSEDPRFHAFVRDKLKVTRQPRARARS